MPLLFSRALRSAATLRRRRSQYAASSRARFALFGVRSSASHAISVRGETWTPARSIASYPASERVR